MIHLVHQFRSVTRRHRHNHHQWCNWHSYDPHHSDLKAKVVWLFSTVLPIRAPWGVDKAWAKTPKIRFNMTLQSSSSSLSSSSSPQGWGQNIKEVIYHDTQNYHHPHNDSAKPASSSSSLKILALLEAGAGTWPVPRFVAAFSTF